jgi:FkbM family methyltransferase
MKFTYLNESHFINESILKDVPSLIKIGIIGILDLIKFKKLYPESKIITYEADEYNYLYNSKIIEHNNTVTTAYNKAVGKTGLIPFYIFKNPQSNSIYPRHTLSNKCVLLKSVNINSINIEQVFNENNLEYLDVLILNCEGGEIPILLDIINKKLFNKIGQICVAFHDPRIYPTENKKNIINKLKNHYNVFQGKATRHIPEYLLIKKG